VSESTDNRIWVVGAGTMGAQIAQLCAMSGYSVACFDRDAGILDGARERVAGALERHFVAKDKMTRDEADAVLGRMDFVTIDEGAAEPPSLAIEAVIETLDEKRRVFGWIEARVPEDTTIASNTSGLSISEIAGGLERRERAAGCHFFNPVAVMKLVEIVRSDWTDEATVERLVDFARRIGKVPVVCRDVTAFVANRCYEALLREALWLAFEGAARPWDVDLALRLGYNLPLGPLELQDRIGTWDLLKSSEGTRERLLAQLSDDGRARLDDMLAKGYLGRQPDGVMRGIYEYFEESDGVSRPPEASGAKAA
jgi:3-hydroxybutyryl-CoA dehydrogenase